MIQTSKYLIFNKQFSRMYLRLRSIFRMDIFNNSNKGSTCPVKSSNRKNKGRFTKVKKSTFLPACGGARRKKKKTCAAPKAYAGPATKYPVPRAKHFSGGALRRSTPCRERSTFLEEPFAEVPRAEGAVPRRRRRGTAKLRFCGTALKKRSFFNRSGGALVFRCLTRSNSRRMGRASLSKGELHRVAKKVASCLEHVGSSNRSASYPTYEDISSTKGITLLLIKAAFNTSLNNKDHLGFDFQNLLTARTAYTDFKEIKIFSNSLLRWFGIKNKYLIGAGIELARYSFPFEKYINKNFISSSNQTSLLQPNNGRLYKMAGCYQITTQDADARRSVLRRRHRTVISERRRERYSVSKFQLVDYAAKAFITCLDQMGQHSEFNFWSAIDNGLILGVLIICPLKAKPAGGPPMCLELPRVKHRKTKASVAEGTGPKAQAFFQRKGQKTSLKSKTCQREYKTTNIYYVSPNEFKQCCISYKTEVKKRSAFLKAESVSSIIACGLILIKFRLINIKNVMIYLYLITKLNLNLVKISEKKAE